MDVLEELGKGEEKKRPGEVEIQTVTGVKNEDLAKAAALRGLRYLLVAGHGDLVGVFAPDRTVGSEIVRCMEEEAERRKLPVSRRLKKLQLQNKAGGRLRIYTPGNPSFQGLWFTGAVIVDPAAWASAGLMDSWMDTIRQTGRKMKITCVQAEEM